MVISSTSAIERPSQAAGEHLRLEAEAVAVVARHPHVGQEVHADPDPPGALARLAAAALHVRREVALRRDRRPSPRAWRRSGRESRRTPRESSRANWTAAAASRSRSAAITREKPAWDVTLAGGDGTVAASRQRGGQHVEDQRGLAAARHAGERRRGRPRGCPRRGPAGCGTGRPRTLTPGRRARRARAGAAPRRAPVRSARQRPVTDSAASASDAGGPAATMRPPSSPAPGPRSITWSAARITSSSCSTTTTVLPASRRAGSRPSSREVSRGCRPAVGSSST